MTTKQTEMSTKPETTGELPPLPEGKAVVRGPVSAFKDPESGTLVDFDCEGPLSYDPEDGEEIFTADQMREYARAALLAADGRGCTRSHPHEEMSPMCELRTEIARLNNKLANLEADGKAGWEVVTLQINGVPPFKNPPEDVVNAAFHVSDWAQRNGYKNWRIGHCCSEDYTRPQQAAQVAQPLSDCGVLDIADSGKQSLQLIFKSREAADLFRLRHWKEPE